MTKLYRKPSHSLKKKIAFSYSYPGGTLENNLNDLKPLFSQKKSFTFQKRSMKMLLHLRANLADQNIQQPQKINLRVTYHPWLLSMKQTFNLIDTCQYCSTSRANQSLHVCSLANASFQNRGVCLQTFPFFPSPFPSFQYLALVHFSHGQRIRFLGSFFAPNGNACYTGYTGD